ncbi:MAG: ATP-binding protein [Actinomycetota bacterium]
MNQPVMDRLRNAAPGSQPDGDAHQQPARLPAPRDADATGLPFPLLVELMLKTIFQGGQLRLWECREKTLLPLSVVESIVGFMRAERLCEIQRAVAAGNDMYYALTDLGRLRAQDALAKNQYIGPCPVSLESYVAQVEKQSIVGSRHVGRDEMRRAFDGIILPDGLIDQIGPALNSGRSIFIYGPAGTGKTYLAERFVLALALRGGIWVPHAFAVDSEIIQVFDPLVHRPMEVPDKESRGLDRHCSHDERWIKCTRPVVIAGGELTLDALDLEFDPVSRFYTAPPQVKANNGLLIIDDLGRQRVAVQDLLNRWIVPMDRRVDCLSLHNGKKFRIPFDVSQVFSTNLSPEDVADEAFLRRFGYKLYLAGATEDRYRKLLQQACSRLGVPFTDDAFRFLVDSLHARSGRPLYACYPHDLVSRVRDRAFYEGVMPELNPENLEWAWTAYFGDLEPTA